MCTQRKFKLEMIVQQRDKIDTEKTIIARENGKKSWEINLPKKKLRKELKKQKKNQEE